MEHRNSSFRGGMSAIAASALLACGGGDGPTSPPPPPPPPSVASVAVSPPTAQVAPGATVQLSAQPRDASGNAVAGRTVTWTTSDAAVATVTSAGLVSGVTPGSATITATADSRSGTATISVAVPIATITLSDSALTLVPNQTATLHPTARSAAGDSLPGRTFAWSSSAPTTATVSAAGVVSALTAGSAVITAAAEGKAATANVMVAEGGIVNGGTPSTITSTDGAVKIEVPAGAAPAGLGISIIAESTPPAPPPEDAWLPGATSYHLGPDGTQFATPVTVTLRYDPATLPPWAVESDLGIRRWDGTQWHALTDIVVDPVAHTISGKTSGFSTFDFAVDLPPVVLTPTPAQINYNQRHVQFMAQVPDHEATAFRYRWVTTGNVGSLIDLFADNEKEYFSDAPLIPDGTIDLVGVEISAQEEEGGPYIPIANTTAKVTSDLNWSFELNPFSQKVGFRETKHLNAVVRERDGGIYESPDLYYEYTYTGNAGDLEPEDGFRVQESQIAYTAWAPSRQVKDPPRGEKVTAKFILRSLEWNGTAFNPNQQTFTFREIGTADAFLEIGEDTWIPRFEVLTIPTTGGACVAAVLYVKKVPGASSYDLKSDGFSLSGFGTTFNRTWSEQTGTGIGDVVDLGSQWRVGMTSGCATSESAISFRQNLYATTFAHIEAEVKVTMAPGGAAGNR